MSNITIKIDEKRLEELYQLSFKKHGVSTSICIDVDIWRHGVEKGSCIHKKEIFCTGCMECFSFKDFEDTHKI